MHGESLAAQSRRLQSKLLLNIFLKYHRSPADRDRVFQKLALRQTISVLALIGVLVLGVLAWRFHTHVEQQDKPTAACFVTGTGQQLCGSAAVAYCDIHEADYRSNDDFDSLGACEAARSAP
jgi:hypothetical protein